MYLNLNIARTNPPRSQETGDSGEEIGVDALTNFNLR